MVNKVIFFCVKSFVKIYDLEILMKCEQGNVFLEENILFLIRIRLTRLQLYPIAVLRLWCGFWSTGEG